MASTLPKYSVCSSAEEAWVEWVASQAVTTCSQAWAGAVEVAVECHPAFPSCLPEACLEVFQGLQGADAVDVEVLVPIHSQGSKASASEAILHFRLI